MGTMAMKATAVWLLLAALAVANGGLRNAALTPRYGEHIGHVLSTIVLCFVIAVVSLAPVGWIGIRGPHSAYFIGVLWLLLTLCFEFLAGHYLFGSSWERLIADYNLARGRVWILVLLTTLYAPRLAAAIRGIRPQPSS